MFNCISSINNKRSMLRNQCSKNGTRTEGDLPVEGVKPISFAHGPCYNIFITIFLAS